MPRRHFQGNANSSENASKKSWGEFSHVNRGPYCPRQVRCSRRISTSELGQMFAIRRCSGSNPFVRNNDWERFQSVRRLVGTVYAVYVSGCRLCSLGGKSGGLALHLRGARASFYGHFVFETMTGFSTRF